MEKIKLTELIRQARWKGMEDATKICDGYIAICIEGKVDTHTSHIIAEMIRYIINKEKEKEGANEP